MQRCEPVWLHRSWRHWGRCAVLQAALTRDERRRRQRSLDAIGVPSFQHVLKVSCWRILRCAAHGACLSGTTGRRCVLSVQELVQDSLPYRLLLTPIVANMQDRGVSPLRRGPAATLQLNIGLYCNQARCAQMLPDQLRSCLQAAVSQWQPQLHLLRCQQLHGGLRQLPCENVHHRQSAARPRVCRRAATATWRARRCAPRPWIGSQRCGAWS